MPDVDDFDYALPVIDRVDDTPIADTNSPSSFLTPGGRGDAASALIFPITRAETEVGSVSSSLTAEGLMVIW
jgi:hypothetical protein